MKLISYFVGCIISFSAILSLAENDIVEVPLISLAEAYTSAYDRLTAKATTSHCKSKIMKVFQQNWKPFFHEEAMPFERRAFQSQCPLEQPVLPPLKYEGDPEGSTANYTPSVIDRREVMQKDHQSLGILYVVLVHQDPEFVVDIIEALNEPVHTFVLHVDTKSPQTFQYMSEYLSQKKQFTKFQQNIFLMSENRVETNWGGFSIVEATMNAIRFGLKLNRTFDYVLDLSGTTFPIQSNQNIRKFLARDTNAIYNNFGMETLDPLPELLHSYVECDGFVHRIARLTRPRGIAVYGGSQWFAIPKHVAKWLVTNQLPINYIEYAQHIVVADEQYFATMLMNSPYCEDMMNRDLNYLIFTDWNVEKGNVHKCLLPDPLRCGRSPTTLTMKMLPAIEMTQALFARKFDPHNSSSMELLELVRNKIKGEQELDHLNHTQVTVDDDVDDDGNPFLDSTIEKPFMILLWDSNSSDNMEHTLDITTFRCLTFPQTAGQLMEIMSCDPNDPNQFFTKSSCVSINTSLFAEFSGHNTNILKGNISDVETYCNLRGLMRGWPSPHSLFVIICSLFMIQCRSHAHKPNA